MPTEEKKPLIEEVEQEKKPLIQEVGQETKPVKKNSGFGGLKGGFLLGGGAKKTAASKPAQKQKPKIEDMTHVKAKPKEDQLKFDEVQNAMKTGLEKNKDEWLNQDLMAKIAQSPRLMAAFQNPQYMQAFQEMGSKPQETMQKYGNDPKFKELLMEFSSLMGTHFNDTAEKKQKEEEAKMQNDPVMKTINEDPQVKAILADPKVTKVIQTM